ncbi:MAG: hypothetical protein M3235_04285 [Actinomycetota bacterium]|nr:hypothetical protein [Actinomycetota bacterium]
MTTTRRHRMPARRKTRTSTRAGRATGLAATTAPGLAGPAIAATPAAPTASMGSGSAAATATFANLQIIGVGGGQYRIIVDGVFAMTQSDAQGFLNNLGSRGGMQYRIMGWDGLSGGEERGTTYYSGPSMPGTHAGGWLYAGTEGIHFHREFQVSSSVLNEDTGWFNYDDEIYVRVRFVDGDGGVREAISNLITNRYY